MERIQGAVRLIQNEDMIANIAALGGAGSIESVYMDDVFQAAENPRQELFGLQQVPEPKVDHPVYRSCRPRNG